MTKKNKKDFKKYPLYGEKLTPATAYSDKESTAGLHYGTSRRANKKKK